MSARRPEDVKKLRQAIVDFFQERLVEAELFLPWSAQKERGRIFDTCAVVEERAEGEGMLLRVRGEKAVIQALSKQFKSKTKKLGLNS